MLGSQSVSDVDDAAWDAVEEGGFLDWERSGGTLSEEGWVISAWRDAERSFGELDEERSSSVVKYTASEEKYSGEGDLSDGIVAAARESDAEREEDEDEGGDGRGEDGAGDEENGDDAVAEGEDGDAAAE